LCARQVNVQEEEYSIYSFWPEMKDGKLITLIPFRQLKLVSQAEPRSNREFLRDMHVKATALFEPRKPRNLR
jgi:hypothetical protein